MCELDFWTAEQLEDVSYPSLVVRVITNRLLQQHDAEEHSEFDGDEEEDEAESDEGYESEDSDSGDEEELYCFGCDLAVVSYSAMLVHLESGNCYCGTTRDDLNRLALRCPSSNRYVVRGRAEYLRQGQIGEHVSHTITLVRTTTSVLGATSVGRPFTILTCTFCRQCTTLKPLYAPTRIAGNYSSI